ncbi:tetratricopeptide repeat protein [Nonomuraea sp. NPDC050643]|uniref:tetratricopeptide repeat protein n=1 Tax=Nonomuraea sp. NPDC050643 TaxID=3155660 RepID=UPI003401ECF6
MRGDQGAARPVFEQARELAVQAGDKLTLSYALRHLGIDEHGAGRLVRARELLEESVRLRREVGFPAGVAANLVGLAYIALDEGRRDDAVALLDEAGALAEDDGAGGVMRHVQEARTLL